MKIDYGTEKMGVTKGKRASNIELYRIIVMLVIIAHHYVVNSGILENANLYPNSVRTLFLYVFGGGGKIGINCFILITGYFMCKSKVTLKKWLKIFLEIVFYNVVIFLIFCSSGYDVFSFRQLIKLIIPFISIELDFTDCYLVFYFFIPFLNLLIAKMSEKEHLKLIGLCLFFFSLWGSIPYVTIRMSYVTWFMVIYIIGAYIRLYPKEIYREWKLWRGLMLGCSILAIASILVGNKMGFGYYFLLVDSNKLFAVLVAITSFIFFLNVPIEQNKMINMLGKSTFGVLLIHASSNTMRRWLWNDILNNVEMYYSDYIYIHAILSVVCVFFVCAVIDIIIKNLLCLVGSIITRCHGAIGELL